MSLPLLQTGEIFADQVTNASLTQNLVYATGTVGAIVVLAGLLMIDAGGVRRRNIATATAEKLIGFFIGTSIGFVLGVVLGASTRIYNLIFPTLVGINSIPKVAFVPLLVLWAGIGTTPAVLTSAIIVIFPIAVIVSGAVAAMDTELRDVLRSLGASRLDVLRKVAIPQAMPQFFGSLKIAITLAFVGTILSESIASNRGLGYMMNRAASDFEVELVFSGLLSLSVAGIMLYCVAVAFEKYFVSWAYRRE
jgi:NitT/TauT family transport system permease protein